VKSCYFLKFCIFGLINFIFAFCFISSAGSTTLTTTFSCGTTNNSTIKNIYIALGDTIILSTQNCQYEEYGSDGINGWAQNNISISPGFKTNSDYGRYAVRGPYTIVLNRDNSLTELVFSAANGAYFSYFVIRSVSSPSATQSIASKTLTKNTAATSFTPVTGSGGTSPLTYSVSPSLPSGLSLNSSTGAITGTPTVTSSATSYTVTVTDANNLVASNTFSLTVSDVVTGTADTTAQSFRVGTAITNFTPLTGTGGTAPLTYFVSTGTLPSGLTLNASTGVVSGTPTTTYSTANVVFSVKDANDSIASTSSTVSITVSAALISTTTTLTTTSNNPLSGQSVTFTATVSPSAATGTVTFKDSGTTLGTSNLSSGVATFTTSSLSVSSHSITATYNGDSNYATSNSGSETVTPYTRSNPTNDANVRGIISAHFTIPIQVTQTQIATLESRLEALHHDEPDGFINGFHLSFPKNSTSSVSQYRDPLDDLNDQLEFVRLFPDYYQDKNSDEPPDKIPRVKSSYKNSQPINLIPDVHIWTSGSLIYGSETFSGTSSNNRFRLSGASVGIDTLISQDVKAGVSLGFSDDHTDINTDGSKNSGRTWLLSSYASYNPTRNVYFDGFIGAGTFNFDTTRYDSNSTSFMTGRRPGWMLFGGIIASVEQHFENLKIVPYGSYNFSQVILNEFTENGSTNWTLNYQSAKYLTQNVTLGVRGQYDVEVPWGVISPTFRFGLQSSFYTDATQIVSYSDDLTTTYTLTQTYLPYQAYLGGIGIMVNTKKSLRTQFEYIYSSSGSAYTSNRFQYSLRVPL
jgi:hypothetical protein